MQRDRIPNQLGPPVGEAQIPHEGPRDLRTVDLEAMRAVAVGGQADVLQQGRDPDHIRVEHVTLTRAYLRREDPRAGDVVEEEVGHDLARECMTAMRGSVWAVTVISCSFGARVPIRFGWRPPIVRQVEAATVKLARWPPMANHPKVEVGSGLGRGRPCQRRRLVDRSVFDCRPVDLGQSLKIDCEEGPLLAI